MPVEEAQLAKLATELGLRMVREFPPFPINLAAAGTPALEVCTEKKVNVETNSANETRVEILLRLKAVPKLTRLTLSPKNKFGGFYLILTLLASS